MSIQRIEKLKRTSMAVVHGNTVYIAGQCGNAGEDFKSQVRTALAKVDRWLLASGTDRAGLLQTTIWLSSIEHFDAMNEIWDEWIDPDNPPARATGVTRPAVPGYDVEIIAVAAL